MKVSEHACVWRHGGGENLARPTENSSQRETPCSGVSMTSRAMLAGESSPDRVTQA